jgi:DNA-binding NtrC family response regulator
VYTGPGAVLVIDDEESLREAGCETLARLGYRPVGFGDPVEAVDYYRSNHKDIDAVVLDLNMPNMSGPECFRKLKEIRSDVAVLIASGHFEGAQQQTAMREGARASILKPYTASELSRAVAGVLGKLDRRIAGEQ